MDTDPSRRRALGLLALLELSDELAAQREPRAIAGTALFNLMGHYGCSRGALWLTPDRGDSRDAVPLRTQGVPDRLAGEVGRHWARWFQAQATTAPDPVLVDRIAKLDPPPPGAAPTQAAGLAVIAPLTAHGRIVGLFALGSRVGGGDFGRMELEVLRASLNVLGTAIENSRLRDREAECRRLLRLARRQLRELGPEAGAGELPLRLTRGDARTLVEAAHEERLPGVTADLRELELSVASDVPPALLDPECAARIVDALLDDAVARTPPGTRIRLRLDNARDESGGWVVIEVGDDGPGLGPERVATLLGSTTRRSEGLGLALKEARLLAERMGARLVAESRVGEGTVLTLRLPAA